MSFTSPLALILLLAIPYIVWVGRPAPGHGVGRAWTSLIVRCLIVLFLILGLAGLQTVRSADDLAVVYLVDHSDSLPVAAQERAQEWVRGAIEALKPNDRAAVVLFGAEALVERPLSGSREQGDFGTTLASLNTNLEEAVQLGLALLPAGSAGRLVILSDGVETIGDATKGAQLAVSGGVPIDVFPLSAAANGEDRPEALVRSVSTPSQLTAGDQFSLVAQVNSNQPNSGLLRVIGNGVVVHETSVRLDEGENRFTIPLVAGEPGFARYRVQLIPANDSSYQNNELGTYTAISGPPRVLLVGPAPESDATGAAGPGESDPLALALLAAGLTVDRTNAASMPGVLATLSDYATIVLANVNAKDLGPRKMATLQSAVRDLGVGLVVVGGPDSFAPGGYYRTPLEETLPLEMQLKDQERRANVTIYFVVDKSGSMSDTSVGGIPKVELAKEAIIRSLELLNPFDRVGVVAFDESAAWVVTPRDLSAPEDASDLVGSIRASGGTDILAGLQAVSQVLPDDPAAVKHIILLTDGGASEQGNPELVREMHENYDATVSVVAIGQGYAPWITDLAEIGQGRFHFAHDPASIPEIFTQETVIATRAYIIEELFWPTQVQRHPILAGINAVPPLYGYVGTTAKPAAQTILTTHQDDPLLAAWHYGLGKSIAWTSDATGRWATEWVTWADFGHFWEQAVKWTISQGRGSNADIAVNLEDELATITIETAAPDGAFLNGLDMSVRLVDPANEALSLPVQQVAPGRYQGSFIPQQEGAYLIRVAGSNAEASLAQTAGWVLGYSPEYQQIASATDDPGAVLLARLATLTGGKTLVEPWESLAHDIPAGRIQRPIWHWLLLAACLMLPLDIALRRLVIGRRELAKAYQEVTQRLRRRRGRQPLTVERTEQVGRLLAAKERAAQQERPVPPTIPAGELEPGRPAGETRSDRPSIPEPPATPNALASRLLDSKKKRTGDK